MPWFIMQHPIKATLLVSLALAAACGGESDPGETGGDVVKVEVAPARVDLATGTAARLRATALDGSGAAVSGKTIRWTSADTLVAIVSEAGEVVARGAGSAQVSAAVDGKAGGATVAVASNPPPRVEALAPASVLAGSGGFTLVVRGEGFARGAVVHWNGEARPTTHRGWKELHATIAAEDVARQGSGAVTVVSPAPGGGASAARALEVSSVPVASIALVPTQVTVQAGGTFQVVAEARDAAGRTLAGRAVQWRTADERIARVSDAGLVTGVAFGATTLTATIEGRSAQAPVTVTAASVAPALTELVPAIAVAGDAGLEIAVRGAGFNGTTIARWNGAPRTTRLISDREVRMTLTAADLAQAGSARVTAGEPGAESNALTFAISAGVAAVEVQGTAHLWTGESATFTAVARDAQGRVLPGRAVTWRSGTTAVATVDASGAVRGAAEGQAEVTATIDGIAGRRPVQVIAAPAGHVIYQAPLGVRTSLVVARPGSGELPEAFFADGRDARDAAVSPDGRWIAFTSRADGNAEIYVVRRDGTGLRRLTADAATDEQPAWSPDGARLAFRSDRAGFADIWVMNADGTGLVNVTGQSIRPGVPDASNPTWSPDGSRIVYAFGDAGTQPFRSVLASARPDGTDPRLLTNRAGYSDAAPAFSPDGRFIALERRAVGSTEVQVVLVSPTGADVILPDYPGEGTSPAWSPDGRWLALVAPSGQVVLHRIGEQIRRPLGALAGSAPAWLPN